MSVAFKAIFPRRKSWAPEDASIPKLFKIPRNRTLEIEPEG